MRTVTTGIACAGTLLGVVLLSACSMLPPILVDGATFCQQSGNKFYIQSTVANVGGPFKGLRVELKGKGFSQLVLGTPDDAKIELMDQWCSPQVKKTVSFIRSGPDAMEATLHATEVSQPQVSVFMAIPAMRPGSGDLTFSISSVEPDSGKIKYFVPVTIYEREMSVERTGFVMMTGAGSLKLKPLK